MNLTFASVCTGIAGFDLGFEQAGMRPLWACDSDEACRDVLRLRFPNLPLYHDMCDLNASAIERPDVMAGGTPCQGFSLAGLRQSLSDDRSNLCLAFVKLVYEIRPAIIVWENVPGSLSTTDNAFGCFLGGLVGSDSPLVPPRQIGRWRETKGGSYFAWPNAGVVAGPLRVACWRVLDSQFFGVAQRRERLFVVADSGDGSSVEILFEPKMLRRHPPSRETAGQDIASTLGASPPGSGPRGDYERMTFIPTTEVSNALVRRDRKGVDSDCTQALVISPPLTTRPYCDNMSREGGLVLPFDETQITSKTNRSNPQPGDPCHTLPANGRPPAVTGFDKGRGESTGEEIAGTLRCNSGKSDGVNDGKADNQCIAFHAQQDPIASNEVSPCLGPGGSPSGQASIAVAYSFQTRIARNDRGTLEKEICPTLNGADAGATSDMRPCVITEECVAFQPRHYTRDNKTGGAPSDISPPLTAETKRGDSETVVAFRAAGQDGFTPGDVSPPLAATDGGGAGVPTAFFLHSQNSEAMMKKGPGPAGGPAQVTRTLDSNGALAAGQGGNVVVSPARRRVRRLTPRECERIQGFPDDWTLRKKLEDGAEVDQKDSPRYRQLGNAVTMVVARWIGKRIVKSLTKLNSTE